MTVPEVPDLSQVTGRIAAAPPWSVAVATAAAALLILALYVRNRRARPGLGEVAGISTANGRGEAARKTAAAAGPLALLGACGMLVSLYGLYGFATESMQLPVPFAVPFMSIWDIAEAVCFVSLYRSAMNESRWTRPMRRTRRTAWGLVAASAAMNAAHAPGNWIATVAFAAVPVVSAKLIEHELDRLLDANAEDDTEDVRPGFVRLFQLGYVHLWAALFARLGLDATSRDGVVQQEARIRRAARKIHQLKRTLEEAERIEADPTARLRQVERAQAAADEAEGRAEQAIDVAGIAGDTPAQLLLSRHLATRGRVRDLATMDVRNPMAMLTLLEELAIVPSAEAIQAGARAAQAEAQREAAEKARDAAQAAQAEAERAAAEVQHQAAEKLAAAEEATEQAKKTVAAAQARAEEATRNKEQAEADGKAAEEAHAQLVKDIADLKDRADRLKNAAQATAADREALSTELHRLTREAQEARTQVKTYRQQADAAREEAQKFVSAKQSALREVENAKKEAEHLRDQVQQLQKAATDLARQRQESVSILANLADQKRKAEEEAHAAKEKADRARTEAQAHDARRNAAAVALQSARDELLEALTSPEAYAPPRWTSPAKVRGWELFLHTVHTEGREPTDSELAGEDRDPSTARKWLAEFRAELAKITAAELPAQQTAHSRTADQAPAHV